MSPSSDIPDGELIQMSLQSSDNFWLIIERYEVPLRRYIHHITDIRDEEVDDILQEIFIKVYRNLHGFDSQLSVSAWIYRITHNLVIDMHRKGAKMKNTLDEQDTEIFLENITTWEDPELITQEKEVLDSLKHALSQLRPEYREILILSYLEEKSYDEISDILEKPIWTIGTLVHRAKKELKEICKSIHCNL